MIDVVFLVAGVLHHINKDESNESLLPLAFLRDVVNAIILETVGIRNIPSDVCYDDTKHY